MDQDIGFHRPVLLRLSEKTGELDTEIYSVCRVNANNERFSVRINAQGFRCCRRGLACYEGCC